MKNAIKYLKKQAKLMEKEQTKAWRMYEKSVIEDPEQEADLMHDDALLEGYLLAISDLERMEV